MKNLLKYIILILMIATLNCVAGRSDSSCQDTLPYAVPAENLSFAESISIPVSELSIPPEIPIGTTNLQINARRSVNIHTRPFIDIVKSGKTLNVSVLFSVQRSTVIINSSIVEHSHKLVCLGKLVI